MSKKNNNPKNALKNILPQNIVSIGDSTLQDTKVYFFQRTYNEIHRFTKGKINGESGGILVGKVISEFGKNNILVSGFIEAKFCEANSATLTFTHKTWEYIHKEIEKRYKGEKIVGWIHTHPDFGIFLSEYDEFIHKNFFSEEYQIAYVIDNIRKEQGVYHLNDGKLKRLSGFFIYDKPGTKISSRKIEKNIKPKKNLTKTIFMIIEFILIMILFFICLSLKLEIVFLQDTLNTVINQSNQNFYQIYEILDEKGDV